MVDGFEYTLAEIGLPPGADAVVKVELETLPDVPEENYWFRRHEAAYDALTEDRPGMFGAVTARAEAQTLRLAMLYALADCSYEIRRTHVESALAV